MSRIRTYLLVVTASILAGMIGAAFGTGTAQAVVSTLVSVVNPTSSPVASLNVTDPGRIAYQSVVNNVGKCSGAECFFTFPTVPSGHRVVVQHIGGIVDFNSSPGDIEVEVFSNSFPVITFFFAARPTVLNSSPLDQPVLFYVDSGDNVTVEVLLGNGANFSGDSTSQFVTLMGYELDCTVAACAPIATQ